MNPGRKTILVVDDAPVNIQFLCGVLKSSYKVKAATNGEKALEIAHKDPQPDLILLDILMPDMDGYEVCHRLKNDAATTDIPVVFITGDLGEEEEQRGLEMGAAAYLTKPVDTDKLLDTLTHFLG